MVHWCQLLSNADMEKKSNMEILYKGAYYKSITSNHISAEGHIVTDNLASPTKHQDFHDTEESKIYNYNEQFY